MQQTVEDRVASIRVELEELRESLKERDPGILSALRTLLIDLDSFREGERPFPRAAVLGLIFAYLRPRIILVIGSIAAVFLAVAQIIVLDRQNKLLEQQNAMIGRQERALTAQTAAVLLDGIEVGPNDPNPRVTLLGTYGDIGFDVLVELARSDAASVASSARAALLKSAKRLESGQALALLQLLIDDHLNIVAALDVVDLKGEQTAQAAWTVRFVERNSAKRNFGEPSAKPVAELLKQWLPSTAEMAAFEQAEKHALAQSIVKYYVEQFDLVEIGGPLFLDEELTALCLGHRKFALTATIRNQVIEISGRLERDRAMQPISLTALVGVVVEKTCSSLSAPIFEIARGEFDTKTTYSRLASAQSRFEADLIRQWLQTHGTSSE